MHPTKTLVHDTDDLSKMLTDSVVRLMQSTNSSKMQWSQNSRLLAE